MGRCKRTNMAALLKRPLTEQKQLSRDMFVSIYGAFRGTGMKRLCGERKNATRLVSNHKSRTTRMHCTASYIDKRVCGVKTTDSVFSSRQQNYYLTFILLIILTNFLSSGLLLGAKYFTVWCRYFTEYLFTLKLSR